MSQFSAHSLASLEREHTSPIVAIAASMPKSFKRRASKACSFCQWRKIRCNVEDRHPCSNCVLENIDCAITKTRKTKKSKLNHVTSEEEHISDHQIGTTISADQPIAIATEDEQRREPLPDENIGSGGIIERLAQQDEQTSLPLHQPEQIVQAITPSASPSCSPQGTADTRTKDRASLVLPDFIEPLPEYLPPEEIEYLQKKGCFDIPAPKFRDAILRSYAEFSHPYMPLLDLGRFLHAITKPSFDSQRVSLLLFQAIMFAGSAHVDIKPLRMLGFLTRKAARKALYLKTKALYDMDYERNRLCVIQTLAIMSYWYETPDDQKNACHWLRIALFLGQREGLHQNPANMDMTETERRMRRRIWWSCVNRDPLCALGLKAPLSIHPQDHDVPDLTVDDYDLGDVPISGFDKVGVRWPPGKRRLLCLASVSQTQLHKQLYSILDKQYKLGDYRRTSVKSSKMVLLPLTTERAKSNLKSLEDGLQSWRQSLPSELQTTAVGSEISDSGFEPFVVFRTVLHMLYHTCLITLYRPWLRPAQPLSTGHESASEVTFQTIVRDSARAITELAVELHQLDLVRHLPQTGISALVAAVVSHISDMLSPIDDVRNAGIRGFDQCSHLLNELRENYYSADFSADFVKLLAQARKLSQKSRTGEMNLSILGDGVDDQITAQSGFSAVGIGPQDDTTRNTSTASKTRPLPEALFPEGVDLSYDSTTNQEHLGWELPMDFESALDGVQAMIPAHHTDEWDYYRNFREETIRLLGDFYEDFQPNLPTPVADIDILSA